MWLHNSARDGRKGDKLSKRWLGPYNVSVVLGKDCIDWLIPKQGMFSRKLTTDADILDTNINIRAIIFIITV